MSTGYELKKVLKAVAELSKLARGFTEQVLTRLMRCL